MKTLFFDVETTGTRAETHDIIQFAGIIQQNDHFEEFNFKIKPRNFDDIDQRALDVNGITKEQLEKYPEAQGVYKEIVTMFDKYINKFDRNDKFIVCGYNVRFDINFLNAFFKKSGNEYLFSYLSPVHIDPYPVLQFMQGNGLIKIENLQLETVCKHFGIEIENAHDAMADIEATKKLNNYILKNYFKSNG